VTDQNVFLVVASMVPGKKMDVNEGIRLLSGNPKIDVPLKKKEAPAPPEPAAPSGPAVAAATPVAAGPMVSRCTVEENGTKRTFTITLEPAGGVASQASGTAAAATATTPRLATAQLTPVYSTFAGAVEIVDIKVKVGQAVTAGSVVAQVEAMKATHDIKSPCAGTVAEIHAKVGDEIDSSKPILTIA
jgi:biotin carboxyl carrier protein